ncbi:hypothetical protein [Xanthomonas campestris]|uniref:hypothetical protein n=1 Tax=Xanthomonas campestris TaxID=339 RepID=UPI0011C07B0B|nr:hypothetical protein [Xanthomonas campestris]MEA9842361.1 hypothetical protein [Xanthomonas campestris pv. raphani]
MEQNSSLAISMRALEFLNKIDEPISVVKFSQLELAGDSQVDNFLSHVSLMMLDYLIKSGFVKSDDISTPSAKIYGLTDQGQEMMRTLKLLAEYK